MVFNFGEHLSIANHFVSELRDKTVQTDRLRFRKNMERLGELMAYEISKHLSYVEHRVETPLGKTVLKKIETLPVLVTVMRAGLAYLQGFTNFFDKADVGFVGAYRREGSHEVSVHLEYLAAPELKDREVILVDPMLATGRSCIQSIEAISKKGAPRHLHIAVLVAAPEGIDYVKRNITSPFTIYTWAVDEKLDENFYIVPGLGDAGDLSYGGKV